MTTARPAPPRTLLRALAGLGAGACVVLAVVAVVLATLGHHEAVSPGRGAVAGISYGLLGGLVAVARPRLAVGWLLLLVGLSNAVSTVLAEVAAVRLPGAPAGDAVGSLAYWLSTWTWVPGYVLVPTLVLMLLPTGRPPSPRWRPVVAATAVAAAAATVAWAVTPYDERDRPVPEAYGELAHPLPVPGAWGVLVVLLPVLVGCAVLAVVSLLVRLRASSGRARDQAAWVLAGGLLTLALFALAWVVPGAAEPLLAVAMLPLPAAVAWATLGRRLWDVDALVNRALVYAAMTVVVLVVYGLVVVLVGGALEHVTRAPDLVAFALAAVAAQPARDRVQRGVNRLLYGDATDPYTAVSDLGERLASRGEAGHLPPDVVEVVATALRLPHVALALPDRPVLAHGSPPPGAVLTTVPLVWSGRTVGELRVAPPPGGLGEREHRLLEDLARQAAAAAHAAVLAEELQRSRERIVASREEERRRIRHDLHDDLGPGLAATALELENAAVLVEEGRAREVLARAVDYLRGTVADVRRIVEGLRPPQLDDLGLAAALTEQVARLREGGLEATVEVGPDLGDAGAAVEVAAYRIVGEALANTARHAAATRVHVALRRDGDTLEVVVTDDGGGFSPGTPLGVGLGSMHQRAAELGGVCVVTSDPARGTTVRALLPLHPLAAPTVEPA